jgi:hypothetical protein
MPLLPVVFMKTSEDVQLLSAAVQAGGSRRFEAVEESYSLYRTAYVCLPGVN